jgi:phytoene synthase
MSPQQYCRDRIAGTASWYAALFTTAQSRNAVEATLALVSELTAIPRECSEPGVARTKLNWWHEDILRAQAAQPQHPGLQAWVASRPDRDPEVAGLLELVAGLATVPTRPPGEDFPQLAQQHQRTGRAVGRLIVQATEPDAGDALPLAEDLGSRIHLAEALADLQAPSATALGEVGHHGPPATATRPGIERVRAGLERSLQDLKGAGVRPLIPLLVLARINLARLAASEPQPERPGRSPTGLHPIRMLWIAWRTAVAARPHGPDRPLPRPRERE